MALHCPIPTTCEWPEAAHLLFTFMQWRVQESHLQAELSQTIRDKDEAQKQCADLQRRHAQAQHELRRKVHSLASVLHWQALAIDCRKAGSSSTSIMLTPCLHVHTLAMLSWPPSCMHAAVTGPHLLLHIG